MILRRDSTPSTPQDRYFEDCIPGNHDSRIKIILNDTLPLVYTLTSLPFKKDEDLERNFDTNAQNCLQDFVQKGGSFQSISNLSEATVTQIRLCVGDAVYPICSGGFCRSQALWAVLQKFSSQITLFPPHAARHGWDPYNGQINRYRNQAQETVPDAFASYFGREKQERFGFEQMRQWKSVEQAPTREGLNRITEFYDQHYYGPNSRWHEKQGQQRVYIAFSNNAHVALYRLNQTNENLKGVSLVAINSDDLITYPPDFLNTSSRSVKAYEYFCNLIVPLFDLRK